MGLTRREPRRRGRRASTLNLFGHPVVDQTIHKSARSIGSRWWSYLCTFALVAYATRKRPSLGVAALILVDPFALYRNVADTTVTLPKIALLAVWIGLALRRDALDAAVGLLRDRRRSRPLLVCATSSSSRPRSPSVTRISVRRRCAKHFKAFEYLLLFATVIVAFALDPNEGVLRVTIALALGLVTVAALSQEVLGAPSGFWFYNHPIPVSRDRSRAPTSFPVTSASDCPVKLAGSRCCASGRQARSWYSGSRRWRSC